MALSPELKLMVSRAQVTHITDDDDEPEEYLPTVREQLALLGLRRATKQELRDIILTAMSRDPEA